MNELEVISKILCDTGNNLIIRKTDIVSWTYKTNPRRMFSTGYGLPGIDSFSYIEYNPTYELILRKDYNISMDVERDKIIFETQEGEFKIGDIHSIGYPHSESGIAIMIKNIVWSL